MAEIDSLEIKITTNAATATQQMEKLKGSLEGVSAAVKQGTGNADETTKKLSALGKAVKTISGTDGFKNLKKNLSALGKNFQKVTKPITNFLKSFKNMVRMRLFRAIVRSVVDAFKEGAANAYQWSKALNGDFASSMDALATEALYIKNALGSLVTSLVIQFGGALETLGDKLVDVINWFSKLIAKASGADTWTRAIKYQTSYADAANKTATAIQRTVLGFDELNKLTQNTTSSDTDYSAMFEEVAFTADELSKTTWKFTLDSIGFEVGDKLNTDDINAVLKVAAAGLAGFTIGYGLLGSTGGLCGAIMSVGLLLTFSSLQTTLGAGTITTSDMIGILTKAAAWGGLGGLITFGLVTAATGNAKLGAAAGSIVATLIGSLYIKWILQGSYISDDSKLTISNAETLGWDVTTSGKIGSVSIPVTEAAAGTALRATQASSTLSEVASALTDAEYAEFWDTYRASLTADSSANQINTEKGVIISDLLSMGFSLDEIMEELKLRGYASGGVVPAGDLFIANESGPELVGQVNGRTTVTNQDQFTEGLANANEGVIDALVSGFNSVITAINNKPSATISKNDIRQAYRQMQNQYGV